MNRSSRLAVLLAVASVVLIPVLPAAASEAPSVAGIAREPVSPQPVTFGIQPATERGPDSRARLNYIAEPGSVIKDFVAVTNVSDTPLNLRVYAADAFNTPTGGFDLLAFGQSSTDVGAWTVPTSDSVAVPGRSTELVPFTLSVPGNASPGDHTAGIVASLVSEQVDTAGNRIMVDKRVGTRIYLRIPGDLRPELEIDNLTSTYHQTYNPVGRGRATVTYTVRNTGNLRLGGLQEVQLRLPWGSTKDGLSRSTLPELLPGNAVTVTSEVDAVPPAGWETATVRVEPLAPPGDLYPIVRVAVASDTFTAVPWALLALLVLIGIAVLGWRVRRRRAAHRGQDPGDTRILEVGDATPR